MGNLYPDLSKYSNEKDLFKRACDAEYEKIQSMGRLVVERDFDSSDIKKIKTKSKVFMIISCICSIITVICTLVIKNIILGIPFLIVAIILFAISYRKRPVANAIYMQNIILPKMGEIFPEYEYVSSMIDIGTFCPSAKEFAPYYGRNRRRINFLSEMGVIERDKFNEVTNILLMDNEERQAELFSIMSYHSSQDSEDDIYKVTTFKGTVVAYEHKFNMSGIVRIVSSYIGDNGREISSVSIKCYHTPEKIETSNQEFNDNFEVYSNSSNSATYILNDNVMNKLMWLKKNYGNFAMAITNNGIYISFQEFDKFIRLPKNQDELNDEFFNELKLNVTKLENTMNDLIDVISKKSSGGVKIKL